MLTAREEGKLLVIGSQATHHPLLAGLGDFVFMGGTVYGASVAPDNEFALCCQRRWMPKATPETSAAT